MLNTTVTEMVSVFVEKLRVVKYTQILKFFREYEKTPMKHLIDSLITSRYLHEVEKGYVSTKYKLLSPLTTYFDTIRAIDVLCLFRASEIQWFEIDSFPSELIFLTVEGVVYDVTVFDQLNWVNKFYLVKKTRGMNLPDNEDDPVNHIAVINDESLIEKLIPLNFAFFVLVDRNGHCTVLSNEE